MKKFLLCYLYIILNVGVPPQRLAFFVGHDFAIWTVSIEMVISCFFLVPRSHQVPYNKQLTDLDCSSCAGE